MQDQNDKNVRFLTFFCFVFLPFRALWRTP